MTEIVNRIGVGIDGLTTALTLKQKRLRVNIYESPTGIKAVGAAFSLANNAMPLEFGSEIPL